MNKQVNVVISKIREAARRVRRSKENLQASRFFKENKESLAESIADNVEAYGDAPSYLVADYKSAKIQLKQHSEKVSHDELAAIQNIIQELSDNIRFGESV